MSDPAAVSLRARSRPRRSQAERTAETRARILAATVESIDEAGFQRTTAAEISRRSGLTWGAVQHHFGGKEGILAAVLEDSFNRFADRLIHASASFDANTPVEERIDVFIDRAWEHFGNTHYRATFEILLHEAGPSDEAHGYSRQNEMLTAWNRVWQRLFPDVDLKRRRLVMLQHFTISALSGLASKQLFSGEATHFIPEELALLKRMLSAEFASREPSSRNNTL